jgi:hypothetical protein
MTADVHAIAIVSNRAGDAADALGGLKDDRADAGAALQFQSRSKAGGTCTDDDGCFHASVGFCGRAVSEAENRASGMWDAPGLINVFAISSMFFVSMRKGQLEVGSDGGDSGTWRTLTSQGKRSAWCIRLESSQYPN